MYRTDEKPQLYRWNIFDKYSHAVNIGISSRSGGISSPPFNSFNQALHCGDKTESVIENRMILCRSQDIPFGDYTCAEQTHSANILIVDENDRGAGRNDYNKSISNTDALIVRNSNIMINIHLADCVPIAIYDYKNNTGALIHAGWKGTAQLIALKTVEFMKRELGSHQENLIAGIGPSISSCCFEIGEDTAGILNDCFDYSTKVIRKDGNKYRADLKEANKEQLISTGIEAANIETSQICTSCSHNQFYSYRVDGGKTGRFSAFFTIL